jgi:glycosyltransferase involved in cell wall biosynthesis
MSPILSIITINLNNVSGLVKTILSVRNQTFKNFEYLIIDGKSTDGSLEVIRENSDLLAFWISEQDTGVYQAMNKGIKKACGDYLLFLNSGDFLFDDTVLQKVFSEKHSKDIIACGVNIVKNNKTMTTTLPDKPITFSSLYLKGLNHQSTFIKKDLFDKLGLYDEEFVYHGDIEFWFRSIILNGVSTHSIPIILTNYNLEGKSTLNSDNSDFREELAKIFNHPVLKRIVPDYDSWKREKRENNVLYWAKSKKVIFSSIKLIYRFSAALSNLTKNKS